MGIACILCGFILISESRFFPGWWVILPVAGTSLIITQGPNTFISKILSAKPLVWIGLISYPIYLWHWPLLSFTRISTGGTEPAWYVRLSICIVSIVLAYLTYIFWEKNIRSRKIKYIRPLTLLLIMIMVGLTGLMIYLHWGFSKHRHYPFYVDLSYNCSDRNSCFYCACCWGNFDNIRRGKSCTCLFTVVLGCFRKSLWVL